MSPWRLFQLAWASARSRRLSLGLTLLSLLLAMTLLLSVERARHVAQQSFARSISGTDLIVGARGSSLQLLLHAVFHLGEPTQEMAWSSHQALAALPDVAWAVPVALGDSHRGFPVLGTTPAYFEHLRHGEERPLAWSAGQPFQAEAIFEAVLGAEVARQLGLRTGSRITLSHGDPSGAPGAHPDHDDEHDHGAHEAPGPLAHADKPFTVVGVLAPTGTPIDRTVHIPLAGIEAVHLDWVGGAPLPGLAISPELVRKFDLTPKRISATLLGLHARGTVFQVQRKVQQFQGEPLQAVMPAVALAQLWSMLSQLEQWLAALSAFVVAMGLACMVAVIWSSLSERRRELALLRSVGAGPATLTLLLLIEGTALALAAAVGALVLNTALGAWAAPMLLARYGIEWPLAWPHAGSWRLLGVVVLASMLASLVPAWRAARQALADGLSPRV